MLQIGYVIDKVASIFKPYPKLNPHSLDICQPEQSVQRLEIV